MIFLYVFADQLGIPVPAVPGLLAVGALAGAGQLNGAFALVSSVGASLLADFIWYLATPCSTSPTRAGAWPEPSAASSRRPSPCTSW